MLLTSLLAATKFDPWALEELPPATKLVIATSWTILIAALISLKQSAAETRKVAWKMEKDSLGVSLIAPNRNDERNSKEHTWNMAAKVVVVELIPTKFEFPRTSRLRKLSLEMRSQSPQLTNRTMWMIPQTKDCIPGKINETGKKFGGWRHPSLKVFVWHAPEWNRRSGDVSSRIHRWEYY
jgi:hypothetical protein